MKQAYQSRAMLPPRFALPLLVIGLPLLLVASHYRLRFDIADQFTPESIMTALTYLGLLLMRPAFEMLKQGWERRWLWSFAALLMLAGLLTILLPGAKELGGMGAALGLLAVLACPIDLLAPFSKQG